MKKPIKPQKPKEPKKQINDNFTFLTISSDDSFKLSSLEESFNSFVKQTNCEDIKFNLGDCMFCFTEDCFDDYHGPSFVSFSFDHIIDNPNYEKELSKFKIKLKLYEAKLQIYNKEMEKYKNYEKSLLNAKKSKQDSEERKLYEKLKKKFG